MKNLLINFNKVEYIKMIKKKTIRKLNRNQRNKLKNSWKMVKKLNTKNKVQKLNKQFMFPKFCKFKIGFLERFEQ